jgi:hypothetical protein
MALVFAFFTVGYILGVWTAAVVFRQPQRAYEDAVPVALTSTSVIALRVPSRLTARRP